MKHKILFSFGKRELRAQFKNYFPVTLYDKTKECFFFEIENCRILLVVLLKLMQRNILSLLIGCLTRLSFRDQTECIEKKFRRFWYHPGVSIVLRMGEAFVFTDPLRCAPNVSKLLSWLLSKSSRHIGEKKVAGVTWDNFGLDILKRNNIVVCWFIFDHAKTTSQKSLRSLRERIYLPYSISGVHLSAVSVREKSLYWISLQLFAGNARNAISATTALRN